MGLEDVQDRLDLVDIVDSGAVFTLCSESQRALAHG